MSETIILLTIIITTMTIILTILCLDKHISILITELKIKGSFDNIDGRLDDYRRLHENEKDLEIMRLENSNKDLKKKNKGLRKTHSGLQRKIMELENENSCLKQQLKYYEGQYEYLEDNRSSKGVIYE